MTDITELAQSLKAAAEGVIKNYDCEWFETGRQICTVHKSKVNLISLANPVNILALVEALEKAQKRNGGLETYSKTALEFREAARDENRHLKLELEIAEKRIAGLEESHAQVIQSRDHYKRMSEEGLKLMAESRTVTVKLPDLRQSVSGERYVWSDGVFNYSQDVKAALTAAGIKVEAE